MPWSPIAAKAQLSWLTTEGIIVGLAEQLS
jgi:hypothetical protein